MPRARMTVKDAKPGQLIQTIGMGICGPLAVGHVYRIAKGPTIDGRIPAWLYDRKLYLYPDNPCRVVEPGPF